MKCCHGLIIHEVLSLTIHEVLYRQRPAEASRRRRISALPAYLPVNRRAKMTAAAAAGRTLTAWFRTAGPLMLSEPPRSDRNRISCLQTKNCEARVRLLSSLPETQALLLPCVLRARGDDGAALPHAYSSSPRKNRFPPVEENPFLRHRQARNTTVGKTLCAGIGVASSAG